MAGEEGVSIVTDGSTAKAPRGVSRVIRNGILWLLAIIAVLILLLWVGVVWERWGTFQRDRVGYMGLKIGSSMDEAIYVFGYPTEVLLPADKERWSYVLTVEGTDPKNSIPAGKTVRDYDRWQLAKDATRVDIWFDPETKNVTRIGCYVDKGHGSNGWCPPIFGVNTTDDEDEIEGNLGKPNKQKYDGSSKSYRWDAIGLEVSLEKKEAYMIVKNSDGDPGLAWFLKHQIF